MSYPIKSLYNQSKSCVRILSAQSCLFTVCVGLCQGSPLSPILFVVFIDRISKCSSVEDGVWFGNLRVASLLFVDDVILLASSSYDFQRAL